MTEESVIDSAAWITQCRRSGPHVRQCRRSGPHVRDSTSGAALLGEFTASRDFGGIPRSEVGRYCCFS